MKKEPIQQNKVERYLRKLAEITQRQIVSDVDNRRMMREIMRAHPDEDVLDVARSEQYSACWEVL